VPALNITTEELMKGGRTEDIGGRNEETAMWRDATSVVTWLHRFAENQLVGFYYLFIYS
jgi:hypothetical protein